MRRPGPLIRGVWQGLCVALAALWAAGSTSAATPEAEVKAAYLYKLASFVRWPDGGGTGSFRICVTGRSDIAQVLGQLVRGEQVGGRAISVEQLGSAQVDRARSCQVLFLGRGGSAAEAMAGATRGAPVLTVGDRNNGTRGGVIDFVMRDGRVRLAISRSAAENRHLELSSKLLDVAVVVGP
jgi:hypothetical protein